MKDGRKKAMKIKMKTKGNFKKTKMKLMNMRNKNERKGILTYFGPNIHTP